MLIHRITLLSVLIAVLIAACSPPGEQAGETRAFEDDGAVRIGIVGAFSGDLSYVGNAVRDGVLYAVDVRNAKGGVFGKDVEVVMCDGEFRPSTEKTCLSKLVDRDHVDAIVLDSPVLGGLSPRFLADLGVPVFLPIALPVDLDAMVAPNVFGFKPPAQSSVEVLAEHLVNVRGDRAIGILASDDLIAETAVGEFKAALVARGVEPVAIENFATGQVDVSAQIQALQRSGAQVMVVLGLGADAARAVQAADSIGWHPQVAGVETLYMRSYRELGQELTNGTLLTLPHTGDADQVDPEFLRWLFGYFRDCGVRAVKVGANAAPDYPGLELPAFELTTIWLDVVRDLDSTDPRLVIPELERTQTGFKPVARGIKWDVDDHLATTEPAAETWVARFQDGHVLYDPDPRSIPALEEARVEIEKSLFADGAPTPSAAVLPELADDWYQAVTSRKDAIVAQAGPERYAAIEKVSADAKTLASALSPEDLEALDESVPEPKDGLCGA
ncbi:MAG: ABC transporter substrate-binding protein [Acidimicrobiia bacterium]|nr:ABC transporter substrate-binding protein [Acidimicrobiia bacterium]